ncbi:hypothetical protein AB0K00_43205 [Dactylosporangium sp. NPDC049525]|uniref:hypothetical protein n=1 Tax=Dactylosporangium sp. NPDC049525 TaxID=3154730 RepID=UPI00343F2515
MSSFTTPAPPVPPISRTRKRAAVLIVAATVALCCAAVLAWWNPWGFVSLDTGLFGAVVVATVLPVTAGALVLLLVRAMAVRITVSILCGVAALVALCGGAGVALFTDPNWKRAVLATSTTGDYQVVSRTQDSLTWRQELHIAYPAGILTRESTRPLACLQATFGDTPKVRVTSASFVAAHEVELTLDNGTTWRTPFDPDDLRPSQTLDAGCWYTGAHVHKVP